MRRIFHISTLIILYLLTTAKSCDNQEKANEERDQARIKVTQDSIRSTFGSDSLSVASLRAFETAAIFKLSDFNDYLAILEDSSTAQPFRDKVREMISRLFISENSVICFSVPHESAKHKVSVKQLLQEAGEEIGPFGEIITDSVRVKQALLRSGDSIYAGKLSYSYTYNRHHSSKGSNLFPANGTIEFFLKLHKKNFGADTLVVWDVFLGNIE